MLEALLKLFGKKEPSGKVAHNRLKVVLIHDRANVSPEMMENLRNDIIDINKKEMKISLADDDDSVALVANIPVSNMRHEKRKDDEPASKN